MFKLQNILLTIDYNIYKIISEIKIDILGIQQTLQINK